MAARPIKEVIDLTGDDESTDPPQTASNPSANRSPPVDAKRVVGNHAYTHPLRTSPNEPNLGPPAKRQRLSENPPPASLTDAQHVAASIAAGLWPYAKAAADNITDARVDKAKLRGEVNNNTPKILASMTCPIVLTRFPLVIVRSRMPSSNSSVTCFAPMEDWSPRHFTLISMTVLRS